MRKEVEASISMIKHSFVEGTFVRLNINTGEEIPLTADMCLEPIIKDLEVLEILKKHTSSIKSKVWVKEGELRPILYIMRIFEDEEGFEKIKEWLDEKE